MKRFKVLAASAVLALSFASCSFESTSSQSGEKLEGQQIIEDSMRRYNDQNSGGYEAFNNVTEKLQERFIYRYDEIGFLSFLCETYGDDGSVYKEYNTGYAVYIEENGSGSKLSKSDDRFVVYNNEISRYSKATDAVFGFVTSGVERVDQTQGPDGSVTYTYVYDPDEAGVGVDGGRLTSYSMDYNVNASGEVYSFRQKAEGEYNSGEPFSFDYTVTLIDPGSVGLIDNPITVEAPKDDAEDTSNEDLK